MAEERLHNTRKDSFIKSSLSARRRSSEPVSTTSGFIVYDRIRLQKEMPTLLPQLIKVTTNALGKTPDDMLEVVHGFDFLVAATENQGIVGYGGYSVEEIPDIGKTLSEEGKMVRRDAQGSGYGSRITIAALALHPDTQYLTFSTQNPHQIQSVRKALPQATFIPIDISYSDDQQAHYDLVKLIQSTGRTNLDPDTGIRKGIYSGQRFGDYQINYANPEITAIDQRLTEIGLKRDEGDGIFVMARMPQLK